MPDIVLDAQHSKWYEHLAGSASQMFNEVPEMLIGGIAGGAAGSLAGPLGTVVGGGAGAFAVAGVRPSQLGTSAQAVGVKSVGKL
jgi:hypothetical protein